MDGFRCYAKTILMKRVNRYNAPRTYQLATVIQER